jgi:hypothetical protein
MTYIPGTGTLSSPKTKNINPKIQKVSQDELISVVNVTELKKPKKNEDDEPDTDVWYHQLKYWVLIGCSLSAIFAILSILNYRFLYLLPLGPYTAYLSWHIRKKIKPYAKKFDAFS